MHLAAWTRGLLFAAVCLLPIACGAKAEKSAKDSKKEREPEPEVKVEDLILGTGPAIEKGDYVEVHYTGTLTDGTKFDSSVDRQEPFTFRVGVGQMIRGFDKGMMGDGKHSQPMKEGGKRRITIPPALGYGNRPPQGGMIPANAELIFEIDLLKVRK
jgi:FKBP-type peptidyl-prolyl cis-trans isomerase FkpA